MAMSQNTDPSSIVDAAFDDIYIESITRLWSGENELRKSKPYQILRNLGTEAIPRIRQRIQSDSAPPPFCRMVLADILNETPVSGRSSYRSLPSSKQISILLDPSFETMFLNETPWKTDLTTDCQRSIIRLHGNQSVNLRTGRIYQDFEANENEYYELAFQVYLPREFISAEIKMQFEWLVGSEWAKGYELKNTLKRQFEDSVGWYLSSCSDISPERATLGRVSVTNPGQDTTRSSFLVDFAFLQKKTRAKTE